MTCQPLYMVKGSLNVTACGYWFTAGGDKGSFGYYPHLKDQQGYPLYPDTQIHGDLRMAATWLEQLQNTTDTATSLVPLIFGQKGGCGRALLKQTDLTLSETAAKKWDHKKNYQIKTRIRIDPAMGVVDNHFLVSREMAWMEANKTPFLLEADLYLGYTHNRETLKNMCSLLTEAATLLTGFGAFRTRGSSRGRVEIEWEDIQEVEYRDEMATDPAACKHFSYSMESLVNMRNRPVAPGSNPQTMATSLQINKDQLRGWFVDTYNMLFDCWPTLEELAIILFPVLYPASKDHQPGYPPAMTTICNEKHEVRDLYGQKSCQENQDQDTFFQTKTKPLSSSWFVTNDPVSFIPANIEHRFRNAMEENRFQTKDNGLFVQQLVKQGTGYAGTITMAEPATTFGKRAEFIFSRITPVINGTVFSAKLQAEEEQKRAGAGKAALLTEPLSYNHHEHPPGAADPLQQVTLAVQRGYNTQLGRARRNRIVLAPGSILTTGDRETMEWQGLGQEKILGVLTAHKKPDRGTAEDRDKPFIPDEPFNFSKPEHFVVISRSHAGWLRNFLHPDMTDANQIHQTMNHVAGKINQKEKQSPLVAVCEAVLELLNKSNLKDCKRFIQAYLEELDLYRWEQKQLKKQEQGHETE